MWFDDLQKITNAEHLPLLAVTSVTAIFLAVVYFIYKNRNLPPGPWGLPFLGYWPFLKKDALHLHLQELGRKYGGVFSFTVTGRLLINLGTFKSIQEAYVKKSECFSSRVMDFNLFSFVFGGGVFYLNGEPWRVLRKFFITMFKEYGVSSIKDDMTSPYHDSINTTIENLKEKNGEPVDIVDLLTSNCSRVLRRVMFNDHGVSDEELKEINEAYGVVVECMTPPSMLLIGEFARRFVLPLNPGYRKACTNHQRMMDMLQQIVDRHKSSFDETNIRNIIDSYFVERNERRLKGDPTASYFTDKVLTSTLVQFLGDGVLGVAFFVSSFIMLLAQYPEEQEKIYEELTEVLGPDRLPSLADKVKLPYTNAFLLESLRTSSFFTTFPSLECTKETTIQGHRIPKGAATVFNMWLAQNDPEVYEDPHIFKPSRYLPGPGKTRPELPVLFGVGKRTCIGEGYAMTQAFLYVTALVKNFKLSFPEKPTGESTLAVLGFTQICASPRSSK